MITAGVDEAGRGSLSGPLVAAAVILPDNWDIPLKDSKKCSPSQREKLANEIIGASRVGIKLILANEIDEIGIQAANIQAMIAAVDRLGKPIPKQVFVDGNLPFEDGRYISIPKADSFIPAVSAASIVAKVVRDRHMHIMGVVWPQYEFPDNKGYPTPRHFELIKKYGLCPIHRRTYSMDGMKLGEWEKQNEITTSDC